MDKTPSRGSTIMTCCPACGVDGENIVVHDDGVTVIVECQNEFCHDREFAVEV